MADLARRPSWKVRNRIAGVAAAFCMGLVAYIAWDGTDSTLNREIANTALLVLGGIVATYVGGACTETIKTMVRQ